MTPPSNQEFVDFFITNWALNFLQKLYINFSLFPNAFKINKKTTLILKITQEKQKHFTNKNWKMFMLFNFDLLNDENN